MAKRGQFVGHMKKLDGVGTAGAQPRITGAYGFLGKAWEAHPPETAQQAWEGASLGDKWPRTMLSWR